MNKNRLLINCQNLTKKYGDIIATKDLDLKIYKQEHIGIIGPNGSGKSTLIEMICGIRQPSKGKIDYFFNDAKPDTPVKRSEIGKDIGVQFQESKYPTGILVNDLLKFYLNLYQIKNKNEVLDFYIKTFKLDGLQKKEIMRLSGGQQQRVNIALSIIHNPNVVVLDEITTGLDITARQEIKSLIQELANENGWTLIIISHNMEEVEFLCDRIIYLRYGHIAHDLSVADVKSKYGSVQKFADTNILADEAERVKLRVTENKKAIRHRAKKARKLKKAQGMTKTSESSKSAPVNQTLNDDKSKKVDDKVTTVNNATPINDEVKASSANSADLT